MPRVLIVDDDKDLVDLLAESLRSEGFAVDTAESGEECLSRVGGEGRPDLVLLDVMLPGINGFETLRRLRSTVEIPVMMLTARGADVDRIVGLEIGADDYLPKPFNPRELVARMHAILRRAARAAGPVEAQSAGFAAPAGVTLDRRTRTVRRGAQVLDLTSSEFDLLQLLMDAAATPVTREELCRAVLGRDYTVFDRGIDNLISNVRRKLGPTDDGRERIKTLRNVGYVYVDV